MNQTVKNIVIVVMGWLLGSVVNGALVMVSTTVIPLPEGVDISTLENLQMAIPLFQPKHFLMPFLAHFLGTLAGAWLAARLQKTHPLRFSMGIGLIFFIGGVINNSMLMPPWWFVAVDLIFAYFPAAFFGYWLSLKGRR